MAEQRFMFSKPVILPARYNSCQWLKSISIGDFASASNERGNLRSRDSYIVMFSLRQRAFVVFFNQEYSSFDISNEKLFIQDLARNCDVASSPRRKATKRKSPKRKSPKRK